MKGVRSGRKYELKRRAWGCEGLREEWLCGDLLLLLGRVRERKLWWDDLWRWKGGGGNTEGV